MKIKITTAYFWVIPKGKKRLPVYVTTTTHDSKTSPEARRGEGLRCMREVESLFSAVWQRTGCNKTIYFRHSHMGPHLYWDQSEVQLPRRNRFPQQAAGQISPNPLLVGFIQDPQILRLERIKQLNEVHLSLCQVTCVVQFGPLPRTGGGRGVGTTKLQV